MKPLRTDNRPRVALAVALLIGLILAFYYGLWLPGLVLIKRDAFAVFLPLKQHLAERLAAGELPQWFPYEALGRPFIGTAHTGTFHFFTALHLMLSGAEAYRLSTLLACLLAAMGAFALGRRLNFSPAGALTAGLAFALSGYVVSLTDNIVYLYSICLLPLFCAALESALDGSRRWMVATAGLWATVFLIGDVQTGYYYGFVALLWAGARARDSYGKTGWRLGVIVLLTVLLAAIQLAPTAAVFAGSERALPVRFHDDALHWSTHPLRMLTMWTAPFGEDMDEVAMASYFFGVPNHGLWAESLYLGVPMTGLAVLGAWSRRDLRLFVWLGGLALVLALGRYGGLYELFYRVVPLWSAFRYPEKFMGLVSFAVAMLAGAGLDALRQDRRSATPWLAAAILCGSFGLLLVTDSTGSWTAATFGAPLPLSRDVTAATGQGFLYSAVAVVGMWLILTGLNRQTLMLGAAISVMALDLARANLGAYHVGPSATISAVPPFVQALTAEEGALGPGRFRLVSLDWNRYLMPSAIMRQLGYYGAASVQRRMALDPELNTPFRIESAERMLPAFSGTLAAMFERHLGPEAAGRYNVKYYVGRRFRLHDSLFANKLVADYPLYNLALFRNPSPVWPRAYLSRQPEGAPAPIDPAALISRREFLNGDVDVIETSAALPSGAQPSSRARIDRYAPETVRVLVETPQPAVLMLLDAFDAGWTASLETGISLPILRANALVRAVIVPAGEQIVTFSYRTPLLVVGAWTSLVGVLACVAVLVWTGTPPSRRSSRIDR